MSGAVASLVSQLSTTSSAFARNAMLRSSFFTQRNEICAVNAVVTNMERRVSLAVTQKSRVAIGAI
jgi:hypothetical protein